MTNDCQSDAWGAKETQYFFALTPEKILDAVESAGLQCTGRCLALNSMENRVYEVEIDRDDLPTRSPERYRIAKFYRPGRWSEEQILEEHRFLFDLLEDEIPVVAPLEFGDGSTLKVDQDTGIKFSIFPKVGGRSPDELSDLQLDQVGRLLARLHNVGAAKQSSHRVRINAQTYGRNSLEYLLTSKSLPPHLESRYQKVVESLCDLTDELMMGVDTFRLHGDCHLGNLLWGDQGPFWVDFDDMVVGPAIQDVWLVVPGRDDYAQRQRQRLLTAYDSMRPFDPTSLRLLEPLRAMRFVHFSAWIARRWQDPAFPRAFGHFGTDRYWEQQVYDLEEVLGICDSGRSRGIYD